MIENPARKRVGYEWSQDVSGCVTKYEFLEKDGNVAGDDQMDDDWNAVEAVHKIYSSTPNERV